MRGLDVTGPLKCKCLSCVL